MSTATKPHRRLSLTQPSEALQPEPAETDQEAASPLDSEQPQVAQRVMAYLTPSEADELDAAWVRLRRLPNRPSKSDILRAALALALGDMENLTSTLSNQYDSTLLRQRASKVKKQTQSDLLK